MIACDGMAGGTKSGEIERSCDLFEQICETKEPFYALALIYDMQYGREEMKMMIDCWNARRERKRKARGG